MDGDLVQGEEWANSSNALGCGLSGVDMARFHKLCKGKLRWDLDGSLSMKAQEAS